jgi:hypothetical protein
VASRSAGAAAGDAGDAAESQYVTGKKWSNGAVRGS